MGAGDRMKMLLVGFDSAWTARKRGALAGAVRHTDGRLESLGPPEAASFDQALLRIDKWRTDLSPDRTLILIDQPTIVKNPTGQRPVERLVSSPVGARRGGMQPAFTGRADMFGDEAPIWPFLEAFGGAADPFKPREVSVFETYPVLTLIAMGWLLKDERSKRRLPKYNPARRATFAQTDWAFVCHKLASAFAERGLADLALQTGELGALRPSKSDQDKLDALLCLLVAVCLAGNEEALAIGDLASGQIVVPYGATLEQELHRRCEECGMFPEQWVRQRP